MDDPKRGMEQENISPPVSTYVQYFTHDDKVGYLCLQNEYLEAFKTSRRKEDDIAVVTLALYVRFAENSDIVEEARIAVGGMAPTTALGANAARALVGK